jgi:hypothetical protein
VLFAGKIIVPPAVPQAPNKHADAVVGTNNAIDPAVTRIVATKNMYIFEFIILLLINFLIVFNI